jgi:hypothetical protein
VFGSDEAGMWGWSIEYTGAETVDCEIYIGGASACDMTGATKVGDFIITPDSMEYRLQPGKYESNAFHVYSGKCEVNDAGKQTEGNNFCIASQELLYADRWDTYPVKAEGGPFVNEFTFDKSFVPGGALWPTDYEVFPVGTESRRFISAHVDVCPIITPAPVGAPPSAEPTFPLIEQGTPGPSPSPVRHYTPTVPDTDYGDNVPTSAPTTFVPPGEDGCEPAWVYCPGRSKCLNDASFNNGVAAMNENGGQDGVWGWSIEYTPSDGLVNDCQIIVGATGCDISTGKQVGNFQMREDFASICLANFGYMSSTFAYYHGECPGNDAGEFLETGVCNPSEVSNYAFSPEEFPIYSSDGGMKVSFTAESTDPMNSPTWPASHTLFPMDGKRYISGYTCVVKNGSVEAAVTEQSVPHDTINWMWASLMDQNRV